MNTKLAKKEYGFNYKNLFWLLPGPVFYGLFRLAFLFPDFVEQVYSRRIFRTINQALSTITGILPFSLGEFMLYAFIAFAVIFIILMIIKSILANKKWWIILLKRMVVLAAVCSMLYALFVGLWAFNYARQPLGDTLELDTSPASASDLYSTCEALIDKANELREVVQIDKEGVFTYSKQDAMLSTAEYYNIAAKQSGYDLLDGYFGKAKPVLYSIGLSKAHISGVYFPFTGEANLNADIPDLFFAFSALHESAHQRGFAREDEANFLAFYVASYSNDCAIEYSAVMSALVHATNKLYNEDSNLYYELRERYSDGIVRDLQNNSEYWYEFESRISEISQKVNNSYLVANGQDDGVKSYGRMVDLLIGLWRNGEL